MAMDVITLVGGLLIVLAGGDLLVRGAVALARTMGISPLVVGLTVVSFGTSAPELAVAVAAAAEGNPEVAFGNVFGSNIANVGLVLGLCSLVRPLAIKGHLVRRELPFMLLATVVAIALFLMDRYVGDVSPRIDRTDALVLVGLFVLFLAINLVTALRGRVADPLLEETRHGIESVRRRSTGVSLLLILAGLVGLAAGGALAVRGASGVALGLGVPQVVVGLTVVAIGTSLPELVTSGIAALRGEADLAVGNVVGSNVFNLLLVLPAAAAIREIPLPAGGQIDLAVTLLLTALALPFAMSHGRRIVRMEGAMLALLYAAFLLWQAWR